jgi:hypothetical protein
VLKIDPESLLKAFFNRLPTSRDKCIRPAFAFHRPTHLNLQMATAGNDASFGRLRQSFSDGTPVKMISLYLKARTSAQIISIPIFIGTAGG